MGNIMKYFAVMILIMVFVDNFPTLLGAPNTFLIETKDKQDQRSTGKDYGAVCECRCTSDYSSKPEPKKTEPKKTGSDYRNGCDCKWIVRRKEKTLKRVVSSVMSV